jgi:hypothetical protein
MKTKPILMLLAVCAMAVAAWSADNLQMGTWQLNTAKSKMARGIAQVTKVTYEADGDRIKSTVVSEDTDGKPSETEWVGKFDGKPYPVTGGPAKSTRSYRVIDARTLAFVNKVDGKVTISGRITVAPDGKSRTVVSYALNAKGVRERSVAVYDKTM